MDEARLKEIETEAVKSRRHFDPDGVDVWLPEVEELIAALRDAWRERDEWKGSYDRWMKDERTRLEERAARAEEEVERLGKLLKQSQDWLQMYEKDTGFRAKVKALEQVREAAEATYGWCETHVQRDVWRDMVAPLPEEIRDLRRALDLAKDPAR